MWHCCDGESFIVFNSKNNNYAAHEKFSIKRVISIVNDEDDTYIHNIYLSHFPLSSSALSGLISRKIAKMSSLSESYMNFDRWREMTPGLRRIKHEMSELRKGEIKKPQNDWERERKRESKMTMWEVADAGNLQKRR